jgi:hypothetical protein
VLGSLLVALGGSRVLALVQLVTNGVLSSGGAGGQVDVGVLGDLLVGLLGGGSGGLVDLVADVVGSVPGGEVC